MSIIQMINNGLKILINRENEEIDEMTTTKIKTKNVSRRPNAGAGAVKSKRDENGVLVCGACGGEIVEVKANGRLACYKCGKESK